MRPEALQIRELLPTMAHRRRSPGRNGGDDMRQLPLRVPQWSLAVQRGPRPTSAHHARTPLRVLRTGREQVCFGKSGAVPWVREEADVEADEGEGEAGGEGAGIRTVREGRWRRPG